MHTALTIAGSDSSGGAGIQADMKAFSANGVYAQTAVVAVVDENTISVNGIHQIPPEFIKSQVRSCLDDIGADVIKIGMLGNVEAATAVRDVLLEYRGKSAGADNIVLDPVVVASSGSPLLEESAIAFLRDELIPLARIITPNLPEAEMLLGHSISEDQFEEAARELSRLGKDKPVSVFLKAGHLKPSKSGTLVDYVYNAETDEIMKLPSPYVDTRNTHGTGCTLSSALAANLAQGYDLGFSAREAKKYISRAIASGAVVGLGKGTGPVHHFFSWY